MPDRSPGIELLRWTCTVMVAYYHCATWAGLPYFESWGLYGVYVFFAISGYGLYLGYRDLSPAQIMARRWRRLAPMFVPAVVFYAIIDDAGVWKTLLSASMLYGFSSPGSTSVVTGGWSLGILMALYVMFCAIAKLKTSWLFGLFVVALVLRVALAETIVAGNQLADVWSLYIQPGSFLVFFVGGMLAAAAPIHASAWGGVLVFLGVYGFMRSSHEELITGALGVVGVFMTVLLVPLFSWAARPSIAEAFRFLGAISFPLYLIHPAAWVVFGALPPIERTIATLVVSSVLAVVASKVYEPAVRRLLLRAA